MHLRNTNLARSIVSLLKIPNRLFLHKIPGIPVSRRFGMDRGTAIDRIWIESFLCKQNRSISGLGAEFGGTEYLERYFPKLEAHCLLPASPDSSNNKQCDLELGCPDNLRDQYDLLIATQVYNFIYETRLAVKNSAHLLKKHGLLLGSVAGISQISRYDADRWGHYHSFTEQSLRRLLEEQFVNVQIESYGNVDTACAYLQGMCSEELEPSILHQHDPDYPVTLCFSALRA